MPKVHPGQEVLSVFCPELRAKTPSQALTSQTSKKGLILSIVSAFFIVLAGAILLRALDYAVTNKVSWSTAKAFDEERVAFEPGQFVRDKLKRGYLGLNSN